MIRNSSSSSSSSKRQWLELKVVELSYRGHSYREIADKLQVPITTISRTLHKLNLQAQQEIRTWIDEKTPFEYQKSLMLLEYMIKKAIEIGEATEDPRVILEAMARLADIDAQKRQLLSDTFVINSAISTLQKQRKYEIIQQQQQHAAAAAVSYNRNSTTTTLSKSAHEKIKRQQQQVNPEKPKQIKLDSGTDTATTHEPEEANG